MKNLLTVITFLFFVCTALTGMNCLGQRPKTNAELLIYAEQTLKPKINDTLIARLFAEAELVFEGEIINSTVFRATRQVLYEFEPYKVFKGDIQKGSVLKIMTYPAPPNVQYLGEWSHEKDEVGVFFVKKDANNDNVYRFVNLKNAWISYPDHILVFRHEKLLSNMLYSKIMAQKGSFCHKTAYFNKKKDFIAENAKGSSTLEIFGLSKDTTPAGVLTGASTVQIFGQGFGTAKG